MCGTLGYPNGQKYAHDAYYSGLGFCGLQLVVKLSLPFEHICLLAVHTDLCAFS